MNFAVKLLRLTFVLASGNSFSNSSNTLVVTGLRSSCVIQSGQFPAFPEADIDVWGMAESDMNALTDFENHVLGVTRNSMLIEANSGTGWTTVFAGQIVAAQPTYQSEPDVALHVKGRVMYYESMATAGVTSYTGATDVATIISGLAARIGAYFENDGVTAKLSNPYLPGTIADQINAVVEHAGIGIYYDYGPVGSTGNPNQSPVAIIITPKGTPRSIPAVTLTPQSGLVSAPTLDSLGWVYARAAYSPALKFGGAVTIAGSILPRANGSWFILQATHLLDAVKPDGVWFTDMHLGPFPIYPLQ